MSTHQKDIQHTLSDNSAEDFKPKHKAKSVYSYPCDNPMMISTCEHGTFLFNKIFCLAECKKILIQVKWIKRGEARS